MKRFLKRLSGFLVVLLASYLVLVFATTNRYEYYPRYYKKNTNLPLGLARHGNSTYLRFQEIELYKDLDVLFVGSSHCYQAFDTRVFSRHGIEAFNMGSMAQSPINSYYLLRRRLDQLSPRVLVIEVYWEVFGNDGVESFLDVVMNVPLTSDIWRMCLETRSLRAFNGMLARVMDMRRPRYKKLSMELAKGRNYVPGGFVEELRCRDDWTSQPPHSIDISARQLRHLDLLLELAEERSISSVLVIQPVPESTRESILNLSEIDSRLEAIADRHGIPFLDFNKMMSLDREHFCDFHHLSPLGVEQFSRLMLEELEKMGLGQRQHLH